MFIRLWNERLETTRKAARSATDIQESELFQAIYEALSIAKLGNHLPDNIQWKNEKKQPLKKGVEDARPSVLLELYETDRKYSVVVAVSKRDSGVPFGHYFNALHEAFNSPGVAGAVLVRPKAELGVGPTAAVRKQYERAVSDRKLRPFPLEQERLTFDQLQCLMKLLIDADGGLAELGNGKKLTASECKKLLAEAGLLKNLKLFDQIFSGWTLAPQGAQVVSPVFSKTVSKPSGILREMDITQPRLPFPPFPTTPALVAPSIATINIKPINTSTAGTPPPVTASPAGDPLDMWAKDMLEKIAAKLRRLSLPVKPLGVQVGPTFAPEIATGGSN